MAKKKLEEEVVVTSEVSELEESSVPETLAEALEPTPIALPKLLKQFHGKSLVLISFEGDYVIMKDVEGTVYKIPQAEYLELLSKE